MAAPLNSGDIRRHVGTVTGSAEDLTISVTVAALFEGEADDVRPEFVGPLRWRPREGDRVVIYQRMGALRPEVGLTWVGWAHDSGDQHLTPPWLDAGLVHLLGESGRIQICLDDENAPDGLPDTPIGMLMLGYRNADEPLTLGNLYKAHLEGTLDLTAEIIDEIAVVLAAGNILNAAFVAWVTAVGTAVPAVATAAVTMIVALNFNTGILTTARNNLRQLPTSVKARLVGPTVPPGTDQKSTIPKHLSDYVFTSKNPDPDPFTNEEE